MLRSDVVGSLLRPEYLKAARLRAERAFRDLRTSTLMPPTVDRMLEGIGKSALGIEGVMFKISE